MVPASIGWFVVFCLWEWCLDFLQAMYGTIRFLWDYIFIDDLWLLLCFYSWEDCYAKDNEKNVVYETLPWEAVKITAHDISDWNRSKTGHENLSLYNFHLLISTPCHFHNYFLHSLFPYYFSVYSPLLKTLALIFSLLLLIFCLCLFQSRHRDSFSRFI